MMQNYIDEAEASLLHTYNRFPVVFDHGNGVCLYDIEGKEYLDFVIKKWQRRIANSDENIKKLIELDNELIKPFEE